MLSKLETVVFQVTTKCPYCCRQCYMEHGDLQLPLEFAREVISYAHSNGAQVVQITGGEPILYDHLAEIIAFAKEKNMYCLMATSGYGAEQRLYRELKRSGLSVVYVSINHIEKAENAKTRESYAESLFAIKTAKACGLECVANVVVSDENIDQLGLLGGYLTRLGASKINLLKPVHSYDGAYVPHISHTTYEKISEILNTYPDRFIVEGCFGEFRAYVRNTSYRCDEAGKRMFCVNADATFSLCTKTNRIRFLSIEEMKEFAEAEKLRCFFSGDFPEKNS